ncbi:MAG: iron donor protein CyaY [Burkholderiaceae bacterium]|nr:iron donor protein CyaY [Burkholderiaceae bacterium]
MTEQEFRAHCERVMRRIEDAIDASDADVDTTLRESVLELEFGDGATLVVSANAALRQIWVAAPSGGFHYRHDGTHWTDTRSGDELFAALGRLIAGHAGVQVPLAR